MNDQEMIKRYIYEVVKRTPQESRDDLRLELSALIEDMCAEEHISAEQALLKLGSPDKFADRYRENSRYLIGPEYYDNYLWVIKIALACIGISALVSAVVTSILNADHVVRFCIIFFQELISTAITGSIATTGIITIVFAVLQHQNVKLQKKSEAGTKPKSWTPSMLQPVPDQRVIINRGDSFVSIVFIIRAAVG